MPGQEGKQGVVAHALTLQLPLEGPVRNGGIKLVLRTADEDQWLGCSFQGSRHDFFISLQQVREATGPSQILQVPALPASARSQNVFLPEAAAWRQHAALSIA